MENESEMIRQQMDETRAAMTDQMVIDAEGAEAWPLLMQWGSEWAEMVRDPEQKIARPRQVYVGEGTRKWAPIEQRKEPTTREDAVSDQI